MEIALFTPFSPDSGGGSVQIKSLLPELHGLEVKWYYLAPKEAHSYKGIWLGANFRPLTIVSDLLARGLAQTVARQAARSIVARMQADLYWIVAHDEGVCIAAELIEAGKKVHLTVHDDPAALFARSRKYRAFQPLVTLVFSRLLKQVSSLDVISSGMKDRYLRMHGVESFEVFRYLASLPRETFRPVEGTLRIGHIGSLYHSHGFSCFAEACRLAAAKNNYCVKIVRIGASPVMDKVAAKYPDLFETAGERSEEEAIRLLQTCDFVYAMYPLSKRFKLLSLTSIPMKLTTYVQAQRPIFAHAPGDSTLANAISEFKLGIVCSSNDLADLENGIRLILSYKSHQTSFESFRAAMLGASHVKKLKEAFQRGQNLQTDTKSIG